MELSPGLQFSLVKGQVRKSKKVLYGLKQTLRVWFERFSRAIQRFGYKQSQADHTLKHSSQGKVTTLIFYFMISYSLEMITWKYIG